MTEPAPIPDTGDPTVAPITRTTFAAPTTRSLAKAIVATTDANSVQRRWATIAGINPDQTVDIVLDEVVIDHVLYDASYQPGLGESVYLDVVGADVMVKGTMAPSLLNPAQRRGTVTAVSGDRETVSVTLDDGTKLTNVPTLGSYNALLNDQVHLLSYGGFFLAIGSLDQTTQTYRRAVGDIEPSLTVKPGTLALTGQTVSRTTYAQLWAWVQANGLVKANLFTNGDGSTTFGLPDFRGRTLIGAGAFSGVTYAVGDVAGANNVTLTTAQMPAHDHNVTVAAHVAHDHNVSVAAHTQHDHNVSVATHGTHDHSVTASMGSDGDHSGHFPSATAYQVTAGTSYGLASQSAAGTNRGGHTHSLSVNSLAVSAGSHSVTESQAGPTTHTVTETTGGPTTHTVTETSVGGGAAVDVRSPSIAVNYVIWT